jgi:exopolysaccharide biosynthesis polyprenyl glycosylphosphotransferase
MVSGGRITARIIHKKLRVTKKYLIHCLLIGTVRDNETFSKKIQKSKAWGYEILGAVNIDNLENAPSTNNEINYLGNIDELEQILNEHKPDEVLINTVESDRAIYMKIANLCSENKIIVKIIPDLYDIFTGSARTLPMYGVPLIEINTQLMRPWEATIKRIIDMIASFLVIILGLPLWIVVGIAIKLESRGSVFYFQNRVGLDGKPFRIVKFRTMVENAENGALWTQVNDPRVTRIGYILRRSHIDEIPQFWNVLKGEMSIVGPRPEVTAIVEKYIKLVPFYVRRLSVRPGITGWWQVNYTSYQENVEEIESRLKDDFFYIENMSLKLDLEIMIRTAFLMIRGHGQT